MNLVDKILLKIFGSLDTYNQWIESFFIEKPKRKKRKKCKNCHCNCHCKNELHLHHWDKDLCACEGCKC
jgi:hypothetical protein